ncbi:MAG: DNA polymerase III subunit alpha [Pontiellaceae bacterium]
MKQPDFCHLHLHSSYSLLDSTIKIKDAVYEAKKLGMRHISITDHAVLFGAVEFYKAAKSADIKPIIGCDTYVARYGIEERSSQRNNMSLVLLAENQKGYENLVKLISRAHLEGLYYKPRVDKKLLSMYSEGLIALSGDLRGEVNEACSIGDLEKAEELALEYLDIFGENNFYLELTYHGLPNIKDMEANDEKWFEIANKQKSTNDNLIKISKKTGIPIVATNDVHYLKQEHAEAHDILTCLQRGMLVADPNRFRYLGNQLYLKSQTEMYELFKDYPDAITNTVKIADRCNVEFSLSTSDNPKKAEDLHFPIFPIPEKYKSGADYLISLAKKGLKKLYKIEDIDSPKNKHEEEIKERFYYEISVLKETNYINYFLVVADFIQYSRECNIPVGPGRGSGAGSLISYCLSITTVDPLEYSLIFERFLNPDRVSPPDFDIDFCPTKRQDVIKYVREKYGDSCVAQIITFGTLGAKTLIRDLGRVLEVSLSYCDRLAKMIPETPGMTIKKALDENPDFKKATESESDALRIMKYARLLEGLPRHTGMHAAGVVIGEQPLIDIIPLTKDQKEGLTVVQFDKDASEAIGLLKMDFLGLKNLTVIYETCTLIKRNHGVEINPEKLPLQDPKVYDLLARGDTIGVFQLESVGMRETLRLVSPDCIQDIIAVIALYRPGPMQFISTFAKRKHGEEVVKYDHELLEVILEETYGIMVYQEQIMQAAQVLAGFTLAEGDLLRRAIGKKKADVLSSQREAFIRGCRTVNSIDAKLASTIFDNIEKFAEYGFNKSHSAGYAMIAYQTAWLKAHYQDEFMAALLSSEMNNTDKLTSIISDTTDIGLNVLAPCVNESIGRFNAAGNGNIRFGMAAIKGVGEGLSDEIVKERDDNGSFQGFIDFCIRMKSPNRRMIEGLIKSGAFDFCNKNRSRLFNGIDMALSRASEKTRDTLSGQTTFFDDEKESIPDEDLPDYQEWDNIKMLADERELIGFYVSGHPLKIYQWELENCQTHSIKDIIKYDRETPVRIGGMITDVRKLYTKKEQPMAVFRIETLDGTTSAVMFPNSYEKFGGLVEDESLVMIGGSILEEDSGDKKLQVLELFNLTDSPKIFGERIIIHLNEKDINDEKLLNIKSIAKKYSGETPVYFDIKCINGKTVKMEAEGIYKVNPSNKFIDELQENINGIESTFKVSSKPLKSPIERRRRRY